MDPTPIGQGLPQETLNSCSPMRSVTRSTRSLFDRLHKTWVAEDAVEESGLLAEIAELRDPTAIPPLTGMLYRQEGRAGAVAAATIQQIV